MFLKEIFVYWRKISLKFSQFIDAYMRHSAPVCYVEKLWHCMAAHWHWIFLIVEKIWYGKFSKLIDTMKKKQGQNQSFAVLVLF